MADESIVKRIHALMSKTLENGCSEAEAMAASAKVQELLHKHQLSMSDIKLKEEKCETGSYDMGMKTKQPIDWVIGAIAHFTDTKCWRSYDRQNNICYKYFGFEHDVLIAKYITKLLDRAMIFAYEDYRKHPDFVPGGKHKEGFMLGMATRLSERLYEMKRAQQRTDVETTGRDLVVVKSAIVTEEYAKLNMKLKQSKQRAKEVDPWAAANGRNAANKVQINPGLDAKSQAQIK
jgi:hypothetical protein